MLRLVGLGSKSTKVVPRHKNSGAQSKYSLSVTSKIVNLIVSNHSHTSLDFTGVMDLDGVITRAAERLGFSIVRPNQRKAIKAFLEGHDVFVSLPTGSGKSLCYAALPYAFDELRGRSGSIAIIISLLSRVDPDGGPFDLVDVAALVNLVTKPFSSTASFFFAAWNCCTVE